MKKRFWGYDVVEADEIIDSLRSQNDILSAKVTRLSLELSAIKEAEAVKTNTAAAVQAIAGSAPDSASAEKLEKLRSENNGLKEENSRLALELTSAKSELANVKRAAANANSEVRDYQKEINDAGQICLKAYEDMEIMKSQVYADMEKRIEVYTTLSLDANRKMNDAIENIRQTKEKTVEYLVTSYETMLENLETFISETDNLESSIVPVHEVRAELLDRMDKMVRATKRPTAAQDGAMVSQIPEDNGIPDETDNLPPLLSRAIRMSKAKAGYAPQENPQAAAPESIEKVDAPPAEYIPKDNDDLKVVGLYTGVKAKDIFK